MPAPVAVYIIVAVVGAAAAAYALKEFVYEPHLNGKFDEWKQQARAYYLKKRTSREGTRAQPFHFASDGDSDDDDENENETDLELKGLFKSNSEIRSQDKTEVAAATAVATTVLPSMSRSLGNTVTHQDQQLRQRNIGPLVDLEDTHSHDAIELCTPSEPTATVLTPLNPFLDLHSLLPKDGHALESSIEQKTERELLSSPSSNTFSPFSDAHILGVESPVVLSPSISPRHQIVLLAQTNPTLIPDSSSNNPWGNISREASSPSVIDLGSLMSSWDSEHDFERESNPPHSVLLRDDIHERDPHEPITSPEIIAWTRDDTVSEDSFTTNTTTLTSSAFTSSIGSSAEEGPANGGPNSPPTFPHSESSEQSVNNISDIEWEHDWDHLNDAGHRRPAP